MNDGFIIGALFLMTLGFVLIIAVTHLMWIMKDRKMRSVATGSDDGADLPFMPYTRGDLTAGILIAALLFGALAQGFFHSH